MKDMHITPDDPRLTAFALGELEGEEALAVAAAVARDPALEAAVAELRAMADDLEGALASEPLPQVEPVAASELKDEVYPFTPKKVLRFPVFWVSGLMAAGFAVLMIVHNRNLSLAPREDVIQYELDLTQMPPAPAESAADSAAADTGAAAREPSRGRGEVVVVANAIERPEAARVPSGEVAAVAPAPKTTEKPRAADDTAPPMVDARGQARLADRSDAAPSPTNEVTAAPLPAAFDDLAVSLPTMIVEITREEAMRASVDRTMERMGLETPAENGSLTVVSATGDTLGAQAELPPPGMTVAADATEGLVTPMRADLQTRLGAQPLGVSPLNTLVDRSVSQGITLARAAPVAPVRETYAMFREQDWQRPVQQPLSTFAVDVDTASYSNVRRFIEQGLPPPVDAVRVEELINAFTYNYAPPAATADVPLAAHLEVAGAPWAPEHKLVRVGLKAREIANAMRAPANLVFLLDVSGSMGAANKLPLAVESMRLLVGQLRPDDRVAIVTYAGTSGLALPSTPASEQRTILAALNELRSGGSTNGSNGIELAYDVAKAHFVEGGINRVILCTDGDFNVGVTGDGELERLITAKARTGVFLTALGFGMGNLQDRTLETLADRGNGHYGYIDSEQEARRLLVEQVEGTLATVAKDVKVQVEFNPRRVAAYRLIGYENRALAAGDFADDAKDGGEMGAGHSVTALYEIVPVGATLEGSLASGETASPLRYQAAATLHAMPAVDHELLVVHVRAKGPEAAESRQWDFPLVDAEVPFEAASEDFRFASAVAGFGMVLRDSPHRGVTSLGDVRRWAERALGFDPAGRRVEFLGLVDRARTLLAR